MLNYLKSQLLSQWGFARIIRLVLGIVVLIQGVQAASFMLAVFGALFILQGLLNAGCCGANGCGIPRYKENLKDGAAIKETTYEEIK